MIAKTTTISHLYTVREAAGYLRTSERSIRELIAFGKITYRRTGGKKKGRIVFRREDLDALLEPAGGPGAKKQTGRAH
jgi:excisionase family DNA binding protein